MSDEISDGVIPALADVVCPFTSVDCSLVNVPRRRRERRRRTSHAQQQSATVGLSLDCVDRIEPLTYVESK